MKTQAEMTSRQFALDTSPQAFGELRSSIDIVDNRAALQTRLQEDGYLYLPGYLDRAEVLEVRLAILSVLAENGYVDDSFPLEEGVVAKAEHPPWPLNWAHDLPVLHKLLYSPDGGIMRFYEMYFGGEVRHFDYTWTRPVPPGFGTAAHMDSVYMGRGTKSLMTAWTSLGDIDLELGGLMILENSHRQDRVVSTYGQKDADVYCANRSEAPGEGPGGGVHMRPGGHLADNPAKLREKLGGRWLTANFRMGDLLTFSMYTIHASLDNRSNRWRLSTDSRYQLASEPADERWIGPHPIAHGRAAKRGMIC